MKKKFLSLYYTKLLKLHNKSLSSEDKVLEYTRKFQESHFE